MNAQSWRAKAPFAPGEPHGPNGDSHRQIRRGGGFSSWLRRPLVFDLKPRQEDAFREDIGTVAGRVAAGFALLTGLLTFFGVKDGMLDQLLRTRPAAALWIFVLVGAGVALGILAPAFSPKASILLWAPLTIGLVAGTITAVVLHSAVDGTSNTTLTIAAATVGIGLVIAVLVRGGSRISAAAGVMVLGLILLSCGIYGAARLSVLSKAFVGLPSVSVAVTGDAVQTATVTVHAAGRDPGPAGDLLVELRGYNGGGGLVLGSATLVADASGTVSSAPTFLFNRSQFNRFDVVSCRAHHGPCSEDPASSKAASFSGNLNISRLTAAGSIRPSTSAGRLLVSVAVRGGASDGVTRFSVERCAGPCTEVASFAASPSDQSPTQIEIAAGTRGSAIRLWMIHQKRTLVATYTTP